MFPHACEYVVLSKKQETITIATLFLEKTDGTIPDYQPGQYITVYFSDLSPTLGKQYSISSAPYEHTLSITVKAVGRFSNRLCSLQKGDTVFVSGPEGFLHAHTITRPIVMIAGGMGVVPFRSMLFQTTAEQPLRRMILLYSGGCLNDMPFLDELCTFVLHSSAIIVKQFLTQEHKLLSDVNNRHLRIEDILQAVDSESAEYLICGPLSFVLDFKNALLERGIKQSDICTEAR